MAIAIVDMQRTTESSTSTSTVTTPAFSTTLAVGDYVLVWCAYKGANGSSTRTSCADSKGNTYSDVSGTDAFLDPCGNRFFYTKVTTGGASATITVTKAAGQNVAMDLVAFHMTGVDSTSVNDGTAVSATGTSTNGGTAMASTTIDQDILLCRISIGDDNSHGCSIGTVQSTPAWTEATKNSNATVRWESNYATFATSGTLTTPNSGWPSMTNPSARAWAMSAVAVKGTAGGGSAGLFQNGILNGLGAGGPFFNNGLG